MKLFNSVKKDEKGLALLMAMFLVAMMAAIAMEVTRETNIEYLVNVQAVNKLKAYYAAKSGIELSLLRIKTYQSVKQRFQSQQQQMPMIGQYMDMIWNMPFAWPPNAMMPEDLNSVDKDMINDKVKAAVMDASYMTTITDEGSKLDLNDLASESKGLREVAKKRLEGFFENKKRNDEDWSRDNQDLRTNEIINNIIDWVDGDQQSLNGGSENQFYKITEFGYEKLPPNRAFRTVNEIKLVAGMTPELFAMLADQITVYGMRAINPNHATQDIFKSIDPSITDEVAGKLVQRPKDTQLGPYRDANDFWSYAASVGAQISQQVQQGIPIDTNAVYNFRVRSVGSFANVTQEIQVIVFDLQKVASSVAQYIKKEKNPQQQQTSPPPQNSSSKGPPRIVYWYER